MSGSHAPLRGYGLDGLPDETRLSATATPGSSMSPMTTNAAGTQPITREPGTTAVPLSLDRPVRAIDETIILDCP